MQFSVGPSLCLLGCVLITLLPNSAQGQVSSPRRFRVKILSPTKLDVSWKEPKGEFEGFKVTYIMNPGGSQKMVELSKQTTNLLIEDFDSTKEYVFKISAVGGGRESKPLHGKLKAQRSVVESTQSQRGQSGAVTQENNEISEGRILGGRRCTLR